MASQTDPNTEASVNTGKPLEGIENDDTGHEQDIQDEAINQHEVDATLAENGFSAFSTASRWTYKTIEEHSLTSPLKTFARNAPRVKSASLQRQQTKSANTLSGQAKQLYRYLVDHKDIAAEIRVQGDGSAFNEGLAPWFVHLLDANEDGVPPFHWQTGPSQYKEIINLNIIGNGEGDEPSQAIAKSLFVQKSVNNADGRSEYFIINGTHDHVRVHGKNIDAYSIAGPLPDFSIIECGNKAIFFFRDLESLNHPNKARIAKKPTKSGKRRLAETEPAEEEQIVKRLKATREEAQKFSKGAATHVPKIQPPPKKSAPSASAARGTDDAIPTSHAGNHPAAQLDMDQSLPAPHNDPLALPLPAASSMEVQPAQLAQAAQLVKPTQLSQPAQLIQPTQPAQPAQPSNLGPTRHLSWNQAYDVGLTRCRRKSPTRASFADSTNEMPEVTNKTYIDMDIIDQAIASVWIALRPGENPNPVQFSFVGCQTSTGIQCEQQYHYISVDDSDTLIIPILLNSRNAEELHGESLASSRPVPEEDDLPWNYQMTQHRKHYAQQNLGSTNPTSQGPQAQPTSASHETGTAPSSEKNVASEKDEVEAPPASEKKKVKAPPALGKDLKNHYVLAVAHHEPATGTVRMDYYNSGRELWNADKIRRAARNSVRHSAWLKNTWPTFTEERVITVQQQLLPTCGQHVIFNAWAVMLGVDVNLTEPRMDRWGDEYHMRRIVNLAIQGRIDAELITAFLHVFGFARPEPIDRWYQRRNNPTSKTESTLDNMRSVLMTEPVCHNYIYELQTERYRSELDAAAGTSHNGGDDPPDDEDAPDGKGGDGGDGGDDDDEDGAGGGDAGGGPENGEDEFSDELFSGWLPIDGPITDQAVTEGEKSPGQKGHDTTPTAAGDVKDGETAQSHPSGPPGVIEAAAGNKKIPGLPTEQNSHQAKGKNPALSSALSKKAYIQKQREQLLANTRKIKDSETGSTSKNCAQITNLADLRGHDILMAITSLWRALLGHEQGDEPCSSPSSPIFCLPIGTEKKAVGRTRRLLFPVSFPTSGDEGLIGPRHYVLCHAIFDGEDEVLIHHYDSSIAPTSQATSQEEAEKYVKNAKWLSIGELATRAWPRIRHSHLLVPQMIVPGSSGPLVVLNAWMLLLRLTPRVGSSPNNGFQTSDVFLQQGLALINYALAGRLHASTIQAFLISWGLTENADGSNLTRARVTPVRTITMNPDILAQVGERQEDVDRRSPHFQSKNYTDVDVERLAERSQRPRWRAEQAMKVRNGDVYGKLEDAETWLDDSPTNGEADELAEADVEMGDYQEDDNEDEEDQTEDDEDEDEDDEDEEDGDEDEDEDEDDSNDDDDDVDPPAQPDVHSSNHSLKQTPSMRNTAIANTDRAPGAAPPTSHLSQHDKDSFYKIAIEAGALNASDAEDSVRSDESSEDAPVPDPPANISTTNNVEPQHGTSNAGISSFYQAALAAGDPFQSGEVDSAPTHPPVTDPVAQAPPEEERSDDDLTAEYDLLAQLCEERGDVEGAERWRKKKWKDPKYGRHDLEF
ncbi:MAG: hypothetical protein OHK93_005422 [Ramalina farinacea]|uniref:Ubiquitin-like protease family profile domain-containing protein n=1 Tax=Ramalina farinacea TaxID=258253 RepID=A0AA43TP59_9LECA|nr:hypothetical protein [Ramalina farinacea]